MIETQKNKKKETEFFLPIHSQELLLLAIRIRSVEPVEVLQLPLPGGRAFQLSVTPNTWIKLPYPIEHHATGSVWQPFLLKSSDYEIDLAYYPWKSRMFRMRALIDNEGTLIAGYRINKNGQTVGYFPPKNDTMKLPEDTYVVPPTNKINEKSIILVSAQTSIAIKKWPEVGIFHI